MLRKPCSIARVTCASASRAKNVTNLHSNREGARKACRRPLCAISLRRAREGTPKTAHRAPPFWAFLAGQPPVAPQQKRKTQPPRTAFSAWGTTVSFCRTPHPSPYGCHLLPLEKANGYRAFDNRTVNTHLRCTATHETKATLKPSLLLRVAERREGSE